MLQQQNKTARFFTSRRWILLATFLAVWGLSLHRLEAQTAPSSASAQEIPSQGIPSQGVGTTTAGLDGVSDQKKPVGQDWPHLGGEILAVGFSSDGKRALSVNSEGLIKIWNVESGQMIRAIHRGITLSAAAFFKDEKIALARSWDAEKTLLLLDMAGGREVETVSGHAGGVNALSVSPDGRFVLSGGWDHQAMLWGETYGDLIHLLNGHQAEVTALAFFPNRALAVSGDAQGKIAVWDLLYGGKPLRFIKGHKKSVLTLAVSPDGQAILSAGVEKEKPPARYSMQLWNAQTGKRLARLGEYPSAVTTAIFSPDGKRILLADRTGRLALLDLATQKEIRTFEGNQGERGAFSSDGRLVLAGGSGRLRLWDAATGNEVGPKPSEGLKIAATPEAPSEKKIKTALAQKGPLTEKSQKGKRGETVRGERGKRQK